MEDTEDFQSYSKFSIFYTKSIWLKNYVYIIGKLCVILETNRGLNFSIRRFKSGLFRGKIDKLIWEKTQKDDLQPVKIT